MGENQDVQYCKGQIITIILNMKDKMHNGKILLILSEIFNSFNSKKGDMESETGTCSCRHCYKCINNISKKISLLKWKI